MNMMQIFRRGLPSSSSIATISSCIKTINPTHSSSSYSSLGSLSHSLPPHHASSEQRSLIMALAHVAPCSHRDLHTILQIYNIRPSSISSHCSPWLGQLGSCRGLMMANPSTVPSMGGICRHMTTQLSRIRVVKSEGINDTIVPNTTQLQYAPFGVRAVTGKRVAANTIEAVRKTLRRRLKKDAKLWIRIEATVPVTRKPEGIRMGKGKGNIAFYATPIRPGQILFEIDRVERSVALQAMESIRAKWPTKIAFVDWN